MRVTERKCELVGCGTLLGLGVGGGRFWWAAKIRSSFGMREFRRAGTATCVTEVSCLQRILLV